MGCALALGLIGKGVPAGAQNTTAGVAFEVATVKPVLQDASHPFNSRHFGVHVTPEGASYWSMTLASLMGYAYGLEPNQVTGPDWISSDRFDIEARLPEGADKGADRKMLQNLLQQRFQLAYHVEKREMEVDALKVGKHGANLRPSLPDEASPGNAAAQPDGSQADGAQAKAEVKKRPDGASAVDMGKRGTLAVKFDQEHWANHFEYSKSTMTALADRLGSCLPGGWHKVVDETGLTGNYQVAYDCLLPRTPVAGSPGAGALPADPPDASLVTRSLEAMGLKLERRKEPRDVYVVERAERPLEN